MTDFANPPLERARELAPVIAAAAEQIERERRLPPPLVQSLHDGGFFRLLLPRALGGSELDPATFVQITETLAAADASTAWVVCQTTGCSTLINGLPARSYVAAQRAYPRRASSSGTSVPSPNVDSSSEPTMRRTSSMRCSAVSSSPSTR